MTAFKYAVDPGPDRSAEPLPETGVLLADFLKLELEPAAWHVDGLIPAGPALGALVGAFKNGKSAFGLQACFAVSSPGAHELLGRAVDRHGPSALIEYEGSQVRLQERARRMAHRYGPDIPVTIHHRPRYADGQPVKVDTDDGEAWLLALCTGRAICVIGPVAKCVTIARENDPAEWQALSERLQRVTDATHCTIVLVHHTRKPSIEFGRPDGVEDYFNSVRGSNAYLGAVDFALGVQRPPDSAEGVLYSLQRDGDSGRIAYDFSALSLLVEASDRPLKQPSAADRMERAYAHIVDHPDCTRRDLAKAIGVTEDTIKGYLLRLEGRVIEHGEGVATRTYRAA